jgi:thymidylate synthase
MDNNLYPPTVMIKNADLMSTWALCIYAVSNYGKIMPSGPNYTDNPDYKPPLIKDICATIEFNGRAIQDIKKRIIHPYYPHHEGYDSYERQFEPGTEEWDHSKQFHYAYGRRLRQVSYCQDFYSPTKECGFHEIYSLEANPDYICRYFKNGNLTEGECYLDQLNFITEHLDPFNKRLQAITWNIEEDLPASIMDEDKKSVPCLQRIQLRNLGNGYYEIWLNWRSRDLNKAYLWNILGLINSIDKLVQTNREKLGQEPLELCKIVDHISSLHIYEPEWEAAKKVPVNLIDAFHCIYI